MKNGFSRRLCICDLTHSTGIITSTQFIKIASHLPKKTATRCRYFTCREAERSLLLMSLWKELTLFQMTRKTPMVKSTVNSMNSMNSIRSFHDLKLFVYDTLCRDHELLMNAFPTTETILKRGTGNSCGVMFCLHGPRSVKFSAIWEKDQNRILFYGPTGKRYSQICLPMVCDQWTVDGGQ